MPPLHRVSGHGTHAVVAVLAEHQPVQLPRFRRMRIRLTDGMPGTGKAGAAGFHDQGNHHLIRVVGNAPLLSIISAGVQLSEIRECGRGFAGPTAREILGAAVGRQLGQTSGERSAVA